MPSEEATRCQGLAIVAGGVERHRNDAFDIPVGRFEATDVYVQSSGNRRANGVNVKTLTLDLASVHHLLRECLKFCLPL